MTQPDPETIRWLVEHSMLAQAKRRAAAYAGQGRLWRQPFAQARPRAATALASAWFTAYPPAIVTRAGESVLRTLADEALWAALAEIGIDGIHIGPTKRAGGLQGCTFTPTIDGSFDRIGMDIDPAYGAEAEFIAMSAVVRAHNAVVIDDIIPAHTGKGADFRLAEMRYQDYPGLYHMVEIAEADWGVLPDVPAGQDSVNLSASVVDQLRTRGYIVGQLRRTIFYEPGVKDTDWSATGVVVGADGVARRWVYLHYFKAGQPALNWLDPTFAAPQLIIGDALHAIDVLGVRILRLDANGFLGVEARPGERAWSEGHPLSVTANQLIAGMVRRAGAFTFQELNLTVDDIAAMSHGGADLSYDFITRPAYQYALLTGDTAFLRLMFDIMQRCRVDPASLIHALQNHDELTLELVHFWEVHKDDRFEFHGRQWKGSELRDHIREVMYDKFTGARAPYNLCFVTNGVSCTTASVIAAALGMRDLADLSDEHRRQIQRAHLLLAMYNAFQPGVFAVSGWDLVGALPLPREQVESLMGDGDTRWIHRGAYDLVNVNPAAAASPAGLPKARMLYGPINEQLARSDSFASRLKRMLAVRKACRIYAAHQVQVLGGQHAGLLVMVHALPDDLGLQATALNFGPVPIEEQVRLQGVTGGRLVNMLTQAIEGSVDDAGQATIRLDGYEGKSLLIQE